MSTNGYVGPDERLASLWKDFVSHPDRSRPRAWWHWMDGNIDLAGIERDLAWLHRVGVRGVQLFDGGMGVPLVVPAPVRPGTALWTEASVQASAPIADWSCLVDGSFGRSLALPRDPDAESTAWVEQVFDEPVTVRSVVLGLPGPRGFGSAPAPTAVLQISDDGGAYQDVATLDPTSVPARSASFAPVTARRFRLVLSGAGAAQALPPMADGVRLPPVLRRSDAFLISEFALRSGGRVHCAETKAGFGAATAPDAVIDLTEQVRDGILHWHAPAGRWRVLRFGASLTGQTNGPAPADSTGLEVDKLDGERVAAYLETHLARFGDRADPDEPSRFRALLADSIESGPQNWTERILEHFVALRGYDPLRWLPALAGFLVGHGGETDRFLFDYRRTLGELLAREYYGTLAVQTHRRGMTFYAEALEDGRPQLGDDLAMRSHTDVPMGAMWTHDPEAGPRPTYVADLKAQHPSPTSTAGRGRAVRRSRRSATHGSGHRSRSSTSPTFSSASE